MKKKKFQQIILDDCVYLYFQYLTVWSLGFIWYYKISTNIVRKSEF